MNPGAAAGSTHGAAQKSVARVDELQSARAQIVALEQLLEVYERTSLEQTRRLDAALAQAKAERERLHEVFMQAPAAITVLEGPEHVFTVANPLYRELVGGREVLGKPVRVALPELEGQGFFELLDGVYESGEAFSAREMLVRIDRNLDGNVEDIYVNFVYQPLRDVDGRTTAVMAHAVDVTVQVQARQDVERKAMELTRLTIELERSNRELDQFAYVASHDLKAPLRGIANLAQWVTEDIGDTISEESANHMRLLQGRVHRMEALIEGILTYSRAGRTAEQVTMVDVDALVRETLELAAPPEDAVITVDASLPDIEAERVPLQQVLLNLISNALKYNPGPAPEVRITGTPVDGEFVQFSVRDNGPGIAPQYHDRIWQIFQTLSSRDKVEGTGIGLSVVRKLVEHRGGRAWLESEVGRGTTFHFTWPTRPRTTA